jgi:hypothetical protein
VEGEERSALQEDLMSLFKASLSPLPASSLIRIDHRTFLD